jgi:hypothetical protein
MPPNVDKDIRAVLKHAFAKAAGGCKIQDGWPCRTCFWDMMDRLEIPEQLQHPLWLAHLAMRNPNGDELYVVTTIPTEEEVARQVKAKVWREGKQHA